VQTRDLKGGSIMRAKRLFGRAAVILSILSFLLSGKVSAQCLTDHSCTIYVQSAVIDSDEYANRALVNAGLYVGNNGGVYNVTAGPYGLGVQGDAYVYGTLYANGKAFKIDNPLDPANKYLYHASVESPDLKTIYDGVVTLDQNGAAWVKLPDWFQALNGDFRYQLTALGGPGANLHIAREVSNNTFKIAGGTASLKVSWQVTGIRHDPSALLHGQKDPVQDKAAADRGKYLDPVAYHQPARVLLLPPTAAAATGVLPASAKSAK
jgi:hypothetical protein